MKKAICVLVNNLYYFEKMVNNFPDNIRDYKLYIVNETRLGDITEDIEKIVQGKAKYKIIKGSTILQRFKREVVDNAFVDKYCMGMNILAQWFLFRYTDCDKILFLDDDIIFSDVSSIFDSDESMFKHYRLSAGRTRFKDNSKNHRLCFKEMFKVFEMKLDKESYARYLKWYINSGNRYYCRKDFDLPAYEKALKRFFENDIIEKLWDNRQTHVTFYFDEKFETLFAMVTGIINNGLKRDVFLECSALPKIIEKGKYSIRHKIWHNVTVSHKANLYRWLTDKNIIK